MATTKKTTTAINQSQTNIPLQTNAQQQRNAIQWLITAVQAMKSGHAKQRAMAGIDFFNPTKDPILGSLLLYFYDAKYKDVLPVWDALPLVFAISLEADSFLGLNLHYLPRELRRAMMQKIIDINQSNLSKTGKIDLTYKMLKSIAGLAPLEHCIKRYLVSHVMSNFAVVSQKKWKMVNDLPLAQWRNGGQQQAYRRKK